jgi:hypothetical protein
MYVRGYLQGSENGRVVAIGFACVPSIVNNNLDTKIIKGIVFFIYLFILWTKYAYICIMNYLVAE